MHLASTPSKTCDHPPLITNVLTLPLSSQSQRFGELAYFTVSPRRVTTSHPPLQPPNIDLPHFSCCPTMVPSCHQRRPLLTKKAAPIPASAARPRPMRRRLREPDSALGLLKTHNTSVGVQLGVITPKSEQGYQVHTSSNRVSYLINRGIHKYWVIQSPRQGVLYISLEGLTRDDQSSRMDATASPL